MAAEGDPAPGTAAGVEFAQLLSNPALTDRGLVVFLARLSGSGVSSSNDRGLWAFDSDGDARLIVREGATDLPVGTPPKTVGGDDPSIRFLGVDFSVGGVGNLRDGLALGVNQSCEIAFWAHFTDDTEGLFVTTLQPCAFFADGFESGDTSTWTSTVN